MATRRVKPSIPKRDPEEIDEGPSDEDLERFADVTRQCPKCQTDLYDDAEVCWKCGHALSGESAAMPRWMIITAIVLLVALAIFLLR